MTEGPLSPELLARMDAYWRAADYLTVGQIYLKSNPLLREPLEREDVKPRLLGHFGTTTGLNFLYTHLNRLIVDNDLDMIFIAGPGHGGPGLVGQSWLDGTWTERYPEVDQSTAGMERLMRQFSWPYGVPSHVAPVVPGSIHEGGELGYSLVHAFGAAFDNPDLIVACVVGDGEAETGSLATSWHSNKFLNPARDGAVLPILHLNGWKIANPTVLARIPREELESLLRGYGWDPLFVQGDEPPVVHHSLAAALDKALVRIRTIQSEARQGEGAPAALRPRWPMIVFATPKGWSGPAVVDGEPVRGTWRAHQVPMENIDEPGHLQILETWLKSYRPEELFDSSGAPVESLRALPPKGDRRMSSNLHANGGVLLRDLDRPDWRDFALEVPSPGGVKGEATRNLGRYLAAVMERNMDRFRVMGPDETASNRLEALYKTTAKTWLGQHSGLDRDLAPDGRVMEVLSENLCQGWLEGYLLTGRHGFFSCYEAFIHIVDSMFNQHAKWLEACNDIPWRVPIASLNYLLSSHVWQQDHNGFSHQDPGFIDHVANKRAGVVRIYLPPDANTLLSTVHHCLGSRNYVNLTICGKAPEWQWLDGEAAAAHCTAGAGQWEWASAPGEPDVVMACCGDVPTLETLAAVTLLREQAPELRASVVNIVDLFRLGPAGEHPHALDHPAFDALFPPGVPVIFAFHGYPGIVHKLTYNRAGHDGFHVHGYREEGSTTTPFDMTVRNGLDRYTLAADAIRRARPDRAGQAERWRDEVHARHKAYVIEHGDDMPEVKDWRWSPTA